MQTLNGGAPILERPHILYHRTVSHYAKTSDGTLSVTRRQVAEHFGKQHKDVLRAIRNLECSGDFNERNFAPVEYLDVTGRSLPQMLRDCAEFCA